MDNCDKLTQRTFCHDVSQSIVDPFTVLAKRSNACECHIEDCIFAKHAKPHALHLPLSDTILFTNSRWDSKVSRLSQSLSSSLYILTASKAIQQCLLIRMRTFSTRINQHASRCNWYQFISCMHLSSSFALTHAIFEVKVTHA